MSQVLGNIEDEIVQVEVIFQVSPHAKQRATVPTSGYSTECERQSLAFREQIFTFRALIFMTGIRKRTENSTLSIIFPRVQECVSNILCS